MRVTHSATFEAPPDEVYAMLTDPALRHGVTVDMVQPTEGVPAFARRFAGDRGAR